MTILNCHEIVIACAIEELKHAYRRAYTNLEPGIGDIVGWSARLALENIANSDALYHNVSHTVMVIMAGLSIIEGKHLKEGRVTPQDWMHYMIALICHDIGYVKGVCQADSENHFTTGIGDEMVELPPGGTDIALTHYHVDRSKRFVLERFGKGSLMEVTKGLDAEIIAAYIEKTRFPAPEDEMGADNSDYGGLVRAADFIGQLGDPNHLCNAPALFYEFEEIGANERMGYKDPGDLRDKYAKFYWEQVSPYIQGALGYLRLTQTGKQWIASLHSHVFEIEHKKEG
ncbi:MAG: hypothetical protein JXA13_17135 [Anaerolineales bacterium]|nr:hypothetical protein [Anaerolineales bacterium]